MKNLRKLLITGLACGTVLAGMTGCTKKEVVDLPPENENTVDVENDLKKVSSYEVLNATGENVVELYIYLAGNEDKGQNFAGDGIAADASVLVDDNASDLFAPVAEDNQDVFILEFVTESGYTGKFETLRREVANIHLLAADAMTGATPILFYVGETTDETVDNSTEVEVEEVVEDVAEEENTEEIVG